MASHQKELVMEFELLKRKQKKIFAKMNRERKKLKEVITKKFSL